MKPVIEFDYVGVVFAVTVDVSILWSYISWHSSVKKALSALMLCAPNNRRRPFSYHTKMAD